MILSFFFLRLRQGGCLRLRMCFLYWFLGWFCFFFSPSSVSESPLSLLRFKLTEIPICSVFSSLFFFVVDDDDVCFVVAVVTVVAVVVEFVFWFSVAAIVVVDFLKGVFFFFFFSPLVTWDHPSSSLSGWSSVSSLGLSLVDGMVFVVAAAAIVVMVVVVVVSGVVILVVF